MGRLHRKVILETFFPEAIVSNSTKQGRQGEHTLPSAHDAAADRCCHLAKSTKHNVVVFDSAPLAPLCGKHEVIHKTLSSEEDKATGTGNIYRQFHEVWTGDFWYAKQTGRQTDFVTILWHINSALVWQKVVQMHFVNYKVVVFPLSGTLALFPSGFRKCSRP